MLVFRLSVALAVIVSSAGQALARPAAAAAAAATARNDPHETDFRTFGVVGCHDQNQGIYTLERSMAGLCRPFAEPIGSLIVVDNLCTLTLFQDANCTQAPVVAPTNVCQNGVWQSYRLAC